MSTDIPMEGQVCKANISPRGRRMRQRVGIVSSVVVLGLVAWALAGHWPWYLRAVVFFPAAGAGFGFFQASRNTCVARAKEGTFEHDDLSKTPAAEADAAASRKVAAGINRDALLLAVAVALAAMATTLIS
jgi:hypothetical protein